MPIQSPPDPFTKLLYRIFYFVRGILYALQGKKDNK